MRDLSATARAVTGAREDVCDLPQGPAVLCELSSPRHGPPLVSVRHEMHPILGEPEARRYGAGALAPRSFGLEPAPDPSPLLGSFPGHPAHDAIGGIEPQAGQGDDGDAELQNELRDTRAGPGEVA
jgi:hypothetical protein